MIVYTLGYSGTKVPKGTSKPYRLKEVVEELDGMLFDIRFSPNSRVECWRKESLQNLLGNRYQWLPSLGNRNYKNGGEIQIAVMEFGIPIILACKRTPILMCGCEDEFECHRYVVAQELANHKQIDDVIELPYWGASGESLRALWTAGVTQEPTLL